MPRSRQFRRTAGISKAPGTRTNPLNFRPRFQLRPAPRAAWNPHIPHCKRGDDGRKESAILPFFDFFTDLTLKWLTDIAQAIENIHHREIPAGFKLLANHKTGTSRYAGFTHRPRNSRS